MITSDVTLLEGTGLAAVERIRATLGRIPVIYISGTTTGCCGSDPMTRAFRKPVDRAAIASVFRELHRLSCA